MQGHGSATRFSYSIIIILIVMLLITITRIILIIKNNKNVRIEMIMNMYPNFLHLKPMLPKLLTAFFKPKRSQLSGNMLCRHVEFASKLHLTDDGCMLWCFP